MTSRLESLGIERLRASLDLRLASGAAAAWLAAAACLGRPWSLSAVLGLTTLVVGVVAVAVHGRALLAAFALVAFSVAVVLLPLSARLWGVHASPLTTMANHRAAVTAQLRVTSDPRLLAARSASGTPRVAVDAVLEQVTVGGRTSRVGGHLLVLAPAAAWRDVLPGQRVRLDGTLAPPLGDQLLAGVLAARTDPVLLGRPPWYQRLAGDVRAGLRASASGLPAGPRGLLPGLVEGDTSQLDPVLADRFRIAGLTHLVAVSGTNCVIVIGAVLLVLRRIGCGPRLCAVLSGLVLVLFVVVARPSPSVLRAAVMAAVALAALASGRRSAGLPMVAATVIGLLAWNPELATDVGFAMSVLATVALLTIAPGWALALRRRHVPPVIAESAAVAAAAHLVTAPLVAVVSGTVSLVAIPANMLAEPVVSPATVFGFAAALTGAVYAPLGAGFAQLAGWPCRWLVGVAEFFGGLDGARIPWPGGLYGGGLLAACTVVVAMLARRVQVRRMLAVAVLVAGVVQIPVRSVASGWPPPGWMFVACDVGQGDGLVLAAGPGRAVVVDAGPDPVAIDRCLHDLHVSDVPLLVLSHYHLDHVGGVAGVFHGRHVGQVVTGPLAAPQSGVSLVASVLRAHGLSVGAAPVGGQMDVGALRLDVLGPATAYRGTRSDPNNSSLVMRATLGGRRILLAADAEIEAQDTLLREGVDLQADILKVAHHGSAYFLPAFLAAVHAQVAVISVGRHNDYGHPSPLLLAQLRRLGPVVRRTDEDGDVAVAADGGRLRTVTRAATGHALADAPRGGRSAPGGDRSSSHATMAGWQQVRYGEGRQRLTPDTDDLYATARLVLLEGDEELLLSRAVEQVTASARRRDADLDVRERFGSQLEPSEIYEVLSPSLFGGHRLLVVRNAHEIRSGAVPEVVPLLVSPPDDVTVVLHHPGGARGKAVLDAARSAHAIRISCARLGRFDERLDFIRGEVRRAGGSITPDGAAALLDAVGPDLRDLAAVCGQLVSDSGGRVDAAVVAAYHRGRAEVGGFAVSDRAIVGDVSGALENLRWALGVGVPAVVIADALADGARSVARVSAASSGRANSYELAQRLGMPPWKVKRAQGQSRGWSEAGIRQAMVVVAGLNADVKGVAVDPGFALERAITALATARTLR